MSYRSYFRNKLSKIVKYQNDDSFIKNYKENRTINLKNLRQYPLTRDTRFSDLAGQISEGSSTPRRYRPNSDEVYYDVEWFKR